MNIFSAWPTNSRNGLEYDFFAACIIVLLLTMNLSKLAIKYILEKFISNFKELICANFSLNILRNFTHSLD